MAPTTSVIIPDYYLTMAYNIPTLYLNICRPMKYRDGTILKGIDHH